MNVDLKNEFKLTNDGDNWGNVMQWLFAIADYLTFETDESVPDEWQFKLRLRITKGETEL